MKGFDKDEEKLRLKWVSKIEENYAKREAYLKYIRIVAESINKVRKEKVVMLRRKMEYDKLALDVIRRIMNATGNNVRN